LLGNSQQLAGAVQSFKFREANHLATQSREGGGASPGEGFRLYERLLRR
jgi:hypothetical protein